MWRDAGLERTAAGLARLLDDPHPLARLVAGAALAREESRGAHMPGRLPGDRTPRSTSAIRSSPPATRRPRFVEWT